MTMERTAMGRTVASDSVVGLPVAPLVTASCLRSMPWRTNGTCDLRGDTSDRRMRAVGAVGAVAQGRRGW